KPPVDATARARATVEGPPAIGAATIGNRECNSGVFMPGSFQRSERVSVPEPPKRATGRVGRGHGHTRRVCPGLFNRFLLTHQLLVRFPPPPSARAGPSCPTAPGTQQPAARSAETAHIPGRSCLPVHR